MRLTWLAGLAVTLLTSIGCELTKKEIRPPEPPDEFRTPPLADARYSEPLRYPKETLNQPLQRNLGQPAGMGLPPAGQRPGIGLNGMRPGGAPGTY